MSNKKVINERVLLDIDSLFDIRLAVLSKLFPDAVSDGKRFDKFMERETDILYLFDDGFSKEDYESFKTLLSNHTLNDLKGNLITTSIMTSLAAEVSASLRDQSTPFKRDYTFTINIYPYQLTDSEKETLIAAFKYRLGFSDIDVRITSVERKWLTPTYLFEHYNRWIIYDCDNWINDSAVLLMENPMPQFNLVTAKLVKNEGHRKKVDEEASLITASMAGVIKLSFLDPYIFSFDEQAAMPGGKENTAPTE